MSDWTVFDRPSQRCHACGCWQKSGVVALPGEGSEEAEIALIGEALGAEEERLAQNFIGRAGELLNGCLTEASLLRSEVWIANSARCRPINPAGKNRKPTLHEIDCCRGYLTDELARIRPKVIVALGDVALTTLMGKPMGGITEHRGKVAWSDEFKAWIVATFHPAYALRRYSQREFIIDDLTLAKRVCEEGGPRTPEPTEIDVILSLDDAYRMRDTLLDAGKFHYDWETKGQRGSTGVHLTKALGFCCSFAYRDRHAYVVPRYKSGWTMFRSKNELRELDEILRTIFESDGEKGGFHVAFDNNITRSTLGVWPRNVTFCGMIAHHCYANHLGQGAHGLKTCAARYLGMGRYDDPLDQWLVEHGHTAEGKPDRDKIYLAPDDMVWLYNGTDSDASRRLEAYLTPRMKESGVWSLFVNERLPAALEHQEIDRIGVRINVPYLDSLSDELAGALEQIETKITEQVGEDINPGSFKQLAHALYDTLDLPILARTDAGEPSTKEEVLLQIKDMHDVVPLILRWRAFAKIKSTYVDGLTKTGRKKALRAVLDEDGYARMNTLIHGTETFRFVTRKPFAIHTFPKTVAGMPSVRALIIPDDGYVFLEKDYVQQEFVIQAILAEQWDLVEALLDRGEDVHDKVMRDFDGVGKQDFLATDGDFYEFDEARWKSKDAYNTFKQKRTKYKSVNFMIMFRGGSRKLARMALGCRCVRGRDVCPHEAEARQYIQDYYERYDRIRWWQYDVIRELRQTGMVRERFGSYRKLPAIFDPNTFLQYEAERQACNYPIQRGGNALMVRALLKVQQDFRGNPPLRAPFPGSVKFTLHDQLVAQVREDLIEEGSYILGRHMEAPHRELGGRSLRTDTAVTRCWGG